MAIEIANGIEVKGGTYSLPGWKVNLDRAYVRVNSELVNLGPDPEDGTPRDAVSWFVEVVTHYGRKFRYAPVLLSNFHSSVTEEGAKVFAANLWRSMRKLAGQRFPGENSVLLREDYFVPLSASYGSLAYDHDNEEANLVALEMKEGREAYIA